MPKLGAVLSASGGFLRKMTRLLLLLSCAGALRAPARRAVRAPLPPASSVAGAWRARSAADPRFRAKLALEGCLAAALQAAAEAQRRRGAFAREADYVVAGVLTAVAGKLAASFQAAPSDGAVTNAFQRGASPRRRVAAVASPAPRLFAVGFLAAAFGYGATAALAALRARLGVAAPAAAPPAVPIWAAAVYTGCFVAVVSNLSYQVLQGLVEHRLVEPATAGRPRARAALLFAGRSLRSLAASGLAIRGMQALGLQAVS